MEPLKRARSLLLGSTLILIAVGIVMIYSASAIYALDTMKDPNYFLVRHLVYLAAGSFLGWLASRVNYQALRRHSKTMLIGIVALLALVLVPHIGSLAGGARRWFKFLGFSVQPSEFLKVVIIFYMADFLDRRKDSLKDFKHTILPALFVLGISTGLILKQPDLGTAVTVAMVVLILFFAAGFRLRDLAGIAALAVPALLYAMLAKSYRRKRILAFFHPWDDPRGVGFQIIQSFLALGSGGIFGRGLGGSQQKLFFLPQSHTDFIFSGMVIVFRTRSFFSQLLGLGLVSLVGFEAVINIGVSVGALPTKGLSLPFISYGGSALIVNLVVTGLLINISKEKPAAA